MAPTPAKEGIIVLTKPTPPAAIIPAPKCLPKSDLIILASRPSMGKSTLALNIATNIAISEKLPVGIFSLEMAKDQIVDRLIASVSGVDLWRLRTGHLTSDGEDNDFSRIPAPVYGKGFIKLYAEFLGLDPAPLIAEYASRFAVPVRRRNLLVTTDRFLAAARRLGRPVHVWTVDDPAEAASLWARGVSGILTNNPAAMPRPPFSRVGGA